MRPNRLTLTAFGPYLTPETIDFDALQPHNLFVISGNTGAGKTSLFDALSYALFGEASGEDRETKALRSDFADDEIPTTVELIFTLRGQRYRIFRQLPYLKVGNISETPGRAELYLLTKEGEVPAVDRQIARDVNAKVLELIGLTPAQFNQLIMLPQGEYKRFLTSPTREKEEILRTVFNTQIYNDLIRYLKEKRDDQKVAYDALNHEQERLLSTIQTHLPFRNAPLFAHLEMQASGDLIQTRPLNIHQALTGLECEIHFYSDEINRLTAEVERRTAEEAEAQSALNSGRQLNQKFNELEEVKGKLLEHNANRPNIDKKRQRIALAEQAQPLEIPYADVLRLRDEARTVKAKLQDAESILNTRKEGFKRAQIAHQKEIDNAPKLAEHEQKRFQLESLKPDISILAKRADELTAATQSYSHLEAALKALERQTSEQKKVQAQLADEIEALEPQAEGLPEKLTKQSEIKEAVELFEEIESAENSLTTKRDTLNSAEAEYLARKAEFEALHTAWMQNQALQLAATLTPNEPCPVCGSLEHPAHKKEHTERSPQNASHETSGTIDLFAELDLNAPSPEIEPISEAEYDAANTHYQAANSTFITAKTEVEYAQNQVNILLKKRAALPHTFANVAKARARLQSVTKAVTSIQTANQKLTQLRQKEREITALIRKREAEIEPKRAEYEAVKNNRLRLETELASLTARIPENLQSPDTFNDALNAQINLVNEMTAAKERAEQNLHKAQTALTEAKSIHNQYAEQYSTIIEAGKSARERLDQTLAEAQFSDEAEFLAARLLPEALQHLRTEVNHFTQKSAILESQIAQLSTDLKAAIPADIEALEQALLEARTNLDGAKEKRLRAEQHKNSSSELKRALEKNHENVAEMGENFGRLEELYNLVRGENPLKISLERYILIEYFDRVIDAANLRLREFTHGQFEFIRSEAIAKRNTQSGLDLDVYDAYTGQTRDVKTLSGGEKFKASLCLSLGMADVIQSYQGGITIDTLFIDEGFGSLDEESLQAAIDILIDLQKSGRMIGVISHVEELKQTLPARIEVVKTKSGFSKTKVIVD